MKSTLFCDLCMVGKKMCFIHTKTEFFFVIVKQLKIAQETGQVQKVV